MGNKESTAKPESYRELEERQARSTDENGNCECVQTDQGGEVVPDCLHKAVEDKDIEKVKQIIRERAASSILARNEDQQIPLHLACKYDENNDIVKVLLGVKDKVDGVDYQQEQQLKAENGIYGNTPLHTAACIGNTEIVKTILECESSEELLEKKNKLKDTPVHSAASGGHIGALELMYEKSQVCITNEGRFKALPIHTACGFGKLDAAKKLLEWNKDTLERPSISVILPAFTITTELKEVDSNMKERTKKCIQEQSLTEDREKINEHFTPLTRACQFGHSKVVKFLLENDAKPNPIALIKAIVGLYRECVELLLFERNFQKDLLFVLIPDDSVTEVLTTPFRELIKHMPDVVERVLIKHCVEFDRFLVNSKSFKVKLHYDLVDDDGENWKRAKNVSRGGGIEAQQAINYATQHSSSRDDETDFDIPKQRIGFNKEAHPLSLMVKHKRERLLTHPVVAGLIHDKWNSIYGVLSFIHWLVYLFFLCCATALLFILPNPNSIYCTREIVNKSEPEIIASCLGMSEPSSNTTNLECEGTEFQPNIPAVFLLAVVMLLYSLLRFVLELYQFATSVRLAYFSLHCKKEQRLDLLGAIKEVKYIWSPINWIEVPLFALSAIFSVTVTISITFEKPLCPLAWQWQMGVVMLWLSWIEFIFLSTQFRLIGVHALMFFRVLKTIIKFIPLALLLIVAFGLTFHFLLYKPELKASPYFTPGLSLLKALSMTVGDVGTDDFFALDINGQVRNTGHLQYVQLSTIIWLLSLILMTILLSNLLIGLAVGDIQTIYDQANFEKLTLQVDYVLAAESQSPKFLRKYGFGNKSEKEFEPNNTSRLETLKNEVIYLLWGGVRYDSLESIERLITDSERKEKD